MRILVALVWTILISSGRVVLSQGSDAGVPGYLPGDVLEPWDGGPGYYARWSNGVSADSSFFPICVWLQSPENNATASEYKDIGVNTHVGLWDGPTESQLTAVTSLHTTAICEQNSVGLTSANNGCIKGWMHQDEPDNAQNGTQLPVPAADVISGYNAMRENDSTRPVYLNLGQGVACDAWYGRGDRTNHPEDYIEYAKGADILSFDTYPMNVFPLPDSAAPWFRAFNNVVGQDIRYVGIGVSKLRAFAGYQKPVWVWIECTNINGDARYALTPAIVRAEVWMAIVHGARGIGYFCHQFEPTFIEAGLLADQTMTDTVHAINDRITQFAQVLNTQTVSNGAEVTLSDTSVSVDIMTKRSGGQTYLFAVATRPGATMATFSLRGFQGFSTVEVVGEGRSLSAVGGVFQDSFSNYDVHIYRVSNPATGVSAGSVALARFHLFQNYPNPFNPTTRIRYVIGKSCFVTLRVYNDNGQEVAALVHAFLSPGEYQVTFAGSGLPSGVYFCRLSTPSFVEAKSLILIK